MQEVLTLVDHVVEHVHLEHGREEGGDRVVVGEALVEVPLLCTWAAAP